MAYFKFYGIFDVIQLKWQTICCSSKISGAYCEIIANDAIFVISKCWFSDSIYYFSIGGGDEMAYYWLLLIRGCVMDYVRLRFICCLSTFLMNYESDIAFQIFIVYQFRLNCVMIRNCLIIIPWAGCIFCVLFFLFTFFLLFFSSSFFKQILTSSIQNWCTNDCGNRNSPACGWHCSNCPDPSCAIHPECAPQPMPDDGSASCFGWFL